MIRVHADAALVYDSRLENYDLMVLRRHAVLNKGGTATIQMPAGHPAYSSFIEYKTIVEIRRDDELLFRGRALSTVDDFNKNRTINCEGEMCFLQDAVVRPYLYQDTPANIFTDLIGIYNAQVETVKRFQVGTISVTDANDYVRLECESAESVLAVINKLLDRCGGYIIFTTNPNTGERVINWYATLSYQSNQEIRFGENLLDFTRDGSSTSLITAVLPYGAKDEATGLPITIESVNDGIDFIQDDAAVALRGRIIAPVYWNDVTEPINLLRKAQEYLEMNRYIVTALRLTALDLSLMGLDFNTFREGDNIKVVSAPHAVNDYFLLVEREEDLLTGDNGSITLGKDRRTLTGASVAGDISSLTDLQRTSQQIKEDYTKNVENAVRETERILSSLIEQTSASIRTEVSEMYMTEQQVDSSISSSMTQLANQFDFEFDQLRDQVDENDAEAREQLEIIHRYIRFVDGDIILGGSDSDITLTIENDIISFKKNGVQFGWWDGNDFHTGNIIVEVNERAQFGNFAFVPRSDGSLSFLKVR